MKSPYLNAATAFAYILGIATFMQTVPEAYFDSITPILAISTILSLLVLSVALMGFLFFYKPAVLFLEGKHIEAVHFFLKTLATFVALFIILVVFILLI